MPSERVEARIGDPLATNSAPPPEAISRFEPRDVPALLPFWLGVLIAAFVGGVLLWVAVGFPLAVHQESRGPLQPLPRAPRLQTAPTGALQRYDAEKRKELAGRTSGTVPIDAAMRATAVQGWGPPK